MVAGTNRVTFGVPTPFEIAGFTPQAHSQDVKASEEAVMLLDQNMPLNSANDQGVPNRSPNFLTSLRSLFHSCIMRQGILDALVEDMTKLKNETNCFVSDAWRRTYTKNLTYSDKCAEDYSCLSFDIDGLKGNARKLIPLTQKSRVFSNIVQRLEHVHNQLQLNPKLEEEPLFKLLAKSEISKEEMKEFDTDLVGLIYFFFHKICEEAEININLTDPSWGENHFCDSDKAAFAKLALGRVILDKMMEHIKLDPNKDNTKKYQHGWTYEKIERFLLQWKKHVKTDGGSLTDVALLRDEKYREANAAQLALPACRAFWLQVKPVKFWDLFYTQLAVKNKIHSYNALSSSSQT
jgi:hypothetical protein